MGSPWKRPRGASVHGAAFVIANRDPMKACIASWTIAA